MHFIYLVCGGHCRSLLITSGQNCHISWMFNNMLSSFICFFSQRGKCFFLLTCKMPVECGCFYFRNPASSWELWKLSMWMVWPRCRTGCSTTTAAVLLGSAFEKLFCSFCLWIRNNQLYLVLGSRCSYDFMLNLAALSDIQWVMWCNRRMSRDDRGGQNSAFWNSNQYLDMLWLLNTEPWTRLVWKDELHVGVELHSLLLNCTVLDMEFCEINYWLRRIKCTCEVLLAVDLWQCFIRCGKHFCIDFHFLFSFHM
jgi:hypothetical protein